MPRTTPDQDNDTSTTSTTDQTTSSDDTAGTRGEDNDTMTDTTTTTTTDDTATDPVAAFTTALSDAVTATVAVLDAIDSDDTLDVSESATRRAAVTVPADAADRLARAYTSVPQARRGTVQADALFDLDGPREAVRAAIAVLRDPRSFKSTSTGAPAAPAVDPVDALALVLSRVDVAVQALVASADADTLDAARSRATDWSTSGLPAWVDSDAFLAAVSRVAAAAQGRKGRGSAGGSTGAPRPRVPLVWAIGEVRGRGPGSATTGYTCTRTGDAGYTVRRPDGSEVGTAASTTGAAVRAHSDATGSDRTASGEPHRIAGPRFWQSIDPASADDSTVDGSDDDSDGSEDSDNDA
jgi:hypothetical protein